jgi:hypothetical protein
MTYHNLPLLKNCMVARTIHDPFIYCKAVQTMDLYILALEEE